MTARVVRGACPTGKDRYRNRAAAIAGRSRVLHLTHRIAALPRPQLWIYRCNHCRGWHLTSQPSRTT